MRPYASRRRQAILEAIDGGMSVATAARTFGVSRSSIDRYRLQRRTTGTLEPRHPPGRPASIRPDGPALVAQVAAHPTATLAEHCRRWAEVTGQQLSITTMSRALARLGWKPVPRRTIPATRHPSKPHTEHPRVLPPHPRSPAMSFPRRPYPTDLTDAEWKLLAPLIPVAKTGGRPARDRRTIMDAVSYVLRAGCAWRLLPHDFPPWQTVYHYVRAWRLDGTWEQIHDALREHVREQAGRERLPTAGVLDSQSVKTTEKGGPGDTTGARK
jgi:transposase